MQLQTQDTTKPIHLQFDSKCTKSIPITTIDIIKYYIRKAIEIWTNFQYISDLFMYSSKSTSFLPGAYIVIYPRVNNYHHSLILSTWMCPHKCRQGAAHWPNSIPLADVAESPTECSWSTQKAEQQSTITVVQTTATPVGNNIHAGCTSSRSGTKGVTTIVAKLTYW